MVVAHPEEKQRAESAPVAILDLAPSPDGRPLTFDIECSPSPTERGRGGHEVTIEPDWTVITPHDLEAERVAAAFGGYTSCLVLVDETIPAFRKALPLLTRRARPTLRRDNRDRWRLPAEACIAGCCTATTSYRTVDKALSHVRSVRHLAARYEVPDWQLAQVLKGAQRVWGPWAGMRRSRREVTSLVREVGGVADLWRAGITPDEIGALADLAGVDEALPVAYFIGLAYGSVDPQWVQQVLRHRPDADVAAWLANLDRPEKVCDADTWGRWLAFGLPRRDVLTMVASTVEPALVEEIAAATGWPPSKAARILAGWIDANTRPTAADIELLARLQAAEARFNAQVLDEVLEEIADLVRQTLWEPIAVTRTEVGIMFAALGTRHAVLTAVLDGVRGTTGLEAYLVERGLA